jgi:hypothetical protein
MASGRTRLVRVYKATKTQVANQLQSFKPGLLGTSILAVQGGTDSTFPFEFELLASTQTIAGVEEVETEFIEVTKEFLVNNLVNALPGITYTADQLADVEIPGVATDPLDRIWFTIEV